ncbi:V-type proton ATPase subunit C 1-A [Galendromus occidentalis]|uniref:V-type proton ATPase subunit C n=1 Tax=Galendromus occidentalis TaxID=34638 RepID=A0AAJ6QRV0_9ACAR|nr:V-type proton ATPase subunit C 1-A [Galendromus occidentalis]
MSEFWLISAPGEQTCQQTFDKLNQATSREQLSTNFKFNLPDLKVGTLDQLVSLSDELQKVDQFTEQVTRKLANYYGDVLEDQKDKVAENLLANGVDLMTYVTHFSWDMAKYPKHQPLPALTAMINKQMGIVDAELKTRSSAYNALKSNIQSYERKQTGSLLVRNLGDLVKKEHFILGSEYLVTILVVVPKANYKEWLATYGKFTDMVVPDTSQLIHEDGEHGLFTVTLFRKVVDDFKNKARLQKFIVRDFEYNEESIKSGKDEKSRMETEKKRQLVLLSRWIRNNFGEAFVAWIHIKALRLFVESVLRYGLPVNFQGMLLLPQKRSMRRLRELLNRTYSHLDNSAASGPVEDIPGFNMGPSEYYPYVYFKIVIDFIESKGH